MIKANINWRTFYLCTIIFRFVLALSDSYIHPDEHFQSFEVLTSRILGYATNIPWEFQSSSPARSFGPLYLIYGPLLYIIKLLNLQLTPIQIWYLARLQITVLSWVITDSCLYWMLPTKPERIKAIFFTSTSYITLVYQSHLFSNSIETVLVILAILIIDDLRYVHESKEREIQQLNKSSSLFWFGVIVSIGIFNRITFPAFLILPSWFLLNYLLAHPARMVFPVIGFAIPTILFIAIDSICFGKATVAQILDSPLEWSHYSITPLNNLLYNSKYENLVQHGIHPYYTHILVNLPQILGPGLIYLFSKTYIRTIPFLSLLSAVVFLSFVPHQELRFLVPMVPLACCCFDLTSKIVRPWMMKVWYLFNIAMAILMGVLHQGGVVPALTYFQQHQQSSVQIWWRTYSPPSWLLASNSTETISLTDQADFSKTINIIDAMGDDIEKVNDKFISLPRDKPIYLITPIASFRHFNSSQFQPIWNHTLHLDMDHLDFTNWESLQPGLGIYQLL
ncbi:GPI mannosyltransferase 4 [Spathaspora passalidarum NRRL Y-27907]|uniref:Mannosyltransferase n=1 Tax=Spathaspora passalidarum (strain NRRL Y-27907 / 11-Y1) TaxID=619300 RepID=G3AMK7_SPAPN|nr:GPI mannosyltransferase 4 [Spathaspora passalidarum NRRL Y-27907]EGW33451.1 GPI mannosyltransferase 4 [Spathaspora passalidarum NRRL Y-27907]